MGQFSDLMGQLEARVFSPDGKISAVYQKRQFYVAFSDDAYHRYESAQLCGQLKAMCQLMWVGIRRGALRAASIAFGYETTGRDFPDDPIYVAYYEERDEISAVGSGPEEVVFVANVGWTDWEVEIEDGALDELSDKEFVAEFVGAVEAMIANYHEKLNEIKRRHFAVSG